MSPVHFYCRGFLWALHKKDGILWQEKSIHPPWPIWLEGDTEPIRLCLDQIWRSQRCEEVVQQGESHLISITVQIVTIRCIVCCVCVSQIVNAGVLKGQSSDKPMWLRHLKRLLWFQKQLFMTALVWWFPWDNDWCCWICNYTVYTLFKQAILLPWFEILNNILEYFQQFTYTRSACTQCCAALRMMYNSVAWGL